MSYLKRKKISNYLVNLQNTMIIQGTSSKRKGLFLSSPSYLCKPYEECPFTQGKAV